jgi:DNA-binding beta-propeller fold protein YncE
MNVPRVVLGGSMLALCCALSSFVHAQIAVSMIDGKQKMVNGVNTVTGAGDRDSVTLFDFGQFPPKRIASLAVATSLVGPPMAAAISPDESLAVVTAALKLDPSDAKKTVPHNGVSVIDLKANPPVVVQTVEAGQGASGVSFSPDGRMVVVANRNEGSLSVFVVSAGRLTKVDTVKVGGVASGPSHAAFTPDGKRLVVTRDGDMFVSIFNVQDGRIAAAGGDITAGIRPYGLALAPNGSFAVVANIGRGSGDADTISVIDLTRAPARTVAFYTVASQPEALAVSPDGRWVAVGSNNGSSRRSDSPLFNANGALALFAVNGSTLVRQGEYPIGRWVQGIAFSGDSSILAVQNTVEGEMQFFKVGVQGLTDSGVRIPIGESAAGLRVRDFAKAN